MPGLCWDVADERNQGQFCSAVLQVLGKIINISANPKPSLQSSALAAQVSQLIQPQAQL